MGRRGELVRSDWSEIRQFSNDGKGIDSIRLGDDSTRIGGRRKERRRGGGKGGEKTYRIEIDPDRADIRSAHRDHREEPMSPSPKQRNSFVQYKQILKLVRHPRRDGEEFACSHTR